MNKKVNNNVRNMIWIAWEIQRRNIELVKSFGGIRLFQLDINTGRLKRYILLGAKTLKIIFSERPEILFVQNPSIVLTILVLVLKNVFRYSVVVDMHTKYIKFNRLMAIVSDNLEAYALKKADLTIVTNEEILRDLKETNVRGCVLPDKVPDLLIKPTKKLKGKANIVFVCTFSSDEPVDEVIEAATLIAPDKIIYITGNIKNVNKTIVDAAPPNIVFTGFLSEEDYVQLLCSADIMLVLTTEENCLVCGAYEAVSIAKPLITSDTKVLREYFDMGTLYTDNTSGDIAEKINQGLDNNEQLIEEMKTLKRQKEKSWEEQKNTALNVIRSLN
jgi:glycosyltransferase involved in cell wall biosynthesis